MENGALHNYVQGHFNYHHCKVANLCTTEHQRCQEQETLRVSYFFQEKL